MRRKNTSEFIQEAIVVHGNLYDYSKVNYKNSGEKVLIIDPDYGEFWQIPGNHLQGHGNPERVRNKKKSTAEFIKEAKKVHGDLYDYSKVKYINRSEKILIIDPEYGEFWQRPYSHLLGQGNSIRRGGIRHTISDFIRKARETHGDLYDYSKVNYTNAHNKILIIDPEYGEFWQAPKHHLNGSNNPARVGGVADSQQDFIRKAKKVHNNFYNYSLVKYINSLSKVKIIDPEYGVFEQSPNSHLQGSESPQRANINTVQKQRLTTDEFIKKANKIHAGFYDYSKIEYQGYYNPVIIIDPEKGEFEQLPSSHLKGCGHPDRASFGFNINLPAIVYYLKILDGKAYKIGVTNRTVRERFVGETSKIEVIKTWYYENGLDALNRERDVLTKYISMKYDGKDLLTSGNTELFNKDILDLDH